MLWVFDHLGSDGVSVDVSDTGEVVLVGVDDTGAVSVTPEVSLSSDGFVVASGDSGVEVLHGPVQVMFGGGGDDVVVV